MCVCWGWSVFLEFRTLVQDSLWQWVMEMQVKLGPHSQETPRGHLPTLCPCWGALPPASPGPRSAGVIAWLCTSSWYGGLLESLGAPLR